MRYKFPTARTKDQNGRIIQSCIVNVYLAGTLTPASIYAASSGGTAVNSVTSSSTDGSFTFYVDDADYATTQKFRIIITSPTAQPYYLQSDNDNVILFNLDQSVLGTMSLQNANAVAITGGTALGLASVATTTLNVFGLTNGRLVKVGASGLLTDTTYTDSQASTAIASAHTQIHSILSATDHSFPGGTTTFLRADGAFASVTQNSNWASCEVLGTLSTTSTTMTDSGISCTVTPTAATKKILVIFTGMYGVNTGARYAYFGLARGSGASLCGNAEAGRTQVTNAARLEVPVASGVIQMTWLDTPGAATNYRVLWCTDSGVTATLGTPGLEGSIRPPRAPSVLYCVEV